MKKFHYSLGRILRLHEKTEERLRIKLSMTQAELRKLMNKDGMLQEAATHAELEAESMSKASAMARAYLDNLIRSRRRIAAAIVRAEEEVQSAVVQWRIARQRRMSLERLRELRFEEYQRVTGLAEQAELEELAALAKSSRNNKFTGLAPARMKRILK